MKVEVPLTFQHSNKSFQQVLAIRYRDITRTKICEYRRQRDDYGDHPSMCCSKVQKLRRVLVLLKFEQRYDGLELCYRGYITACPCAGTLTLKLIEISDIESRS
eukprot:scaffold2990_cov142-Alexandrium_tamarense.AAC.1